MNSYMGTVRLKKGAAVLRIVAYLLSVTLVFSVVSVLCAVNTAYVCCDKEGIIDLMRADFNGRVITISEESFTMYPDVFYMPDDFAANRVTQTGARYGTSGMGLGDYGTLRLELRLPPGVIYAIAGRNVSYAQQLFINGKAYPSIGVPGTSAETVTPKSIRYTAAFQPESDVTEIVIHHSAFVHADGGGLYPLTLGLADVVTRSEQLKTFQTAAVTFALVTAVLFFFGLFLFFDRNRYFLYFAVTCACIALRGLFTGDKEIMFLLPNLDWYDAIRLEYLSTFGVALFSVLYSSALFPRVVNKYAMRGYIAFCTLNAVFICLLPPLIFTRYAFATIWGCVLFCALQLLTILRGVLYKKMVTALSAVEQALLLIGLLIYLLLSVLGINAHMNNTLLGGLDYTQVSMMVFLFINILVLALGFARTERELDETIQSWRDTEETNRLLERLNRVKSEFLDDISHEMKTPLTVMSSYAGVTLRQIKMNAVGDNTMKNLDAIQREAMRLGRLVEQIKAVSLENDRQLTLIDTDTLTLFKRAAFACEHLNRENKNKIIIKDGSQIALRVDKDGICQVLINLIYNAIRHTKNGVITISAELIEDTVTIVIEDDGEGICTALIDSVFDRGVSGSGGSGLGLPICKEIVEEHGGKIELESEFEKGTTVRFTLPSAREGEQA